MTITACTLGRRALFVVCLTLLEEGAGVRWAVRAHTSRACNSPSGEDLVYVMTMALMYSTTAAVASADIVAGGGCCTSGDHLLEDCDQMLILQEHNLIQVGINSRPSLLQPVHNFLFPQSIRATPPTTFILAGQHCIS